MFRLLSITICSALIFVSSFANAQAGRTRKTTTTTTTTISSGPAAWSGDDTWEVQSYLTGGAMTTQKVGNDTVTTIEAGASVAKQVHENIQAGGEVSFYNSSGGPKNRSYIQLAGFGTYNFQPVLRESFYAKAGLGFFNTVNERNEDEGKIGFFAGGGKRIPILGSINYVPEARLLKIGSQDMTFHVYFVNFSVIF